MLETLVYLIKKADKALYKSKKSGNRITMFSKNPNKNKEIIQAPDNE